MNVSVVVAVHRKHNSPRFLGACLKSMERQRYPKDGFEVVVVADGCRLDRTLLPEGLRTRVREIRRNVGPAEARNRGMRMSRGGYMALIDADAKAAPDWLGELLRSFDRSYVGAAAGKIVDQNGRWENKPWMFPDNPIPPFSGFGNMMIKKEALKAVGFLDPKLRMGEDVDFCYKLAEKGYTLAYSPNAAVIHHRDYPLLEGFVSGVYRRRLMERYGRIHRFEPSPWKMMGKFYEKSGHVPFPKRASLTLVGMAGFLAESVSLRLRRRAPEPRGRSVKTAWTVGGRPLIKPANIMWWFRGGEAVIVDMETCESYRLDGAGKDIWAEIMDGKTLTEIAKTLEETYGITKARAKADVEDLTDDLVRNRILHAGRRRSRAGASQ